MAQTTRRQRPEDGVQTVDKALSVLEFLSGQPQGRRGSEIARALGFHPATTHRLLSTLEARGYVRKDPVTKCYTLGLKCLELGGAVLAGIELPSIARPYLEALQAETGETVHLMINDRGQGIYLTKIESEHRVRMASQLGRRSYLHCTAVGKAMLAFMDEKEVDAIIEEHGLPRFTPNTITDKEILKKELLTIRARGYAVDNEEEERGIRCVGAPVFNHVGEPIAAVSVAGIVFRLDWAQVEAIAPKVMETAQEISKALGYGIDGAAHFDTY